MNFTVETTEVAEAEIENAFLSLVAWDSEFAGRWLEGLNRVLGTLSFFPGRHSRVEGHDAPGYDIRRMLYRNGRIVYRVLFVLIDADGDGEPDTVRVLHVRHGAQRPIDQPNEEADL